MSIYNYYTQTFSGITLSLVEHEGALITCQFGGNTGRLETYIRRFDAAATMKKSRAPLAAALEQLAEYFTGSRRSFTLPVSLHGTEFQKKVWAQLKKIPYGKTTTYGAIAAALGNVNLARPAGGAIGANPVSIIIPCHRVIGISGAMTGFGGGIPVKRQLLALEKTGGQNTPAK